MESSQAGRAFPSSPQIENGKVVNSGGGGMLLLDYFAARAPGIGEDVTVEWASNRYGFGKPANNDPMTLQAWWDAIDAIARYAWAEAMIRERSERLGRKA